MAPGRDMPLEPRKRSDSSEMIPDSSLHMIVGHRILGVIVQG